MKKAVWVVIFVGQLFVASAHACDPCALYQASLLQSREQGQFSFSIAEQYTKYKKANAYQAGTMRDGELVDGYSTTQFSLGYDLSDRQSLQLTLPVISRDVEKIQGYRSDEDLDTGLGDIILSSNYSFYKHRTPQDFFVVSGATLGLKLPTGDTGSLDDFTLSANDTAGANPEQSASSFIKHHPLGSTSGGRALTMGSGSYDVLLGLNFVSRYQRWFLLSALQYTIRKEGDFDYQYANDLLFDFGPGYYFSLNDVYSLAGRLALTGEFKGQDELKDEKVEASNISNLYLGPEFISTYREKLIFSVATDFRVTNEDYSVTVVPDFRIRSSLGFRF